MKIQDDSFQSQLLVTAVKHEHQCLGFQTYADVLLLFDKSANSDFLL